MSKGMGQAKTQLLQLGATVGLSLSWPTGWPDTAAHEDARHKQCATLRRQRRDSPSARPAP
jgi:hypothetical protein